MRRFSITPEDFGITPSPIATILGGDAKTNAAIIESVLMGERGPQRDVVLINAAAAIVAGGVAANLKEGFAPQKNRSIAEGTKEAKRIAALFLKEARSPLLIEEGWTRDQEMAPKASFEQRGRGGRNVPTTPSAPAVAAQHFLRSQPPLLGSYERNHVLVVDHETT